MKFKHRFKIEMNFPIKNVGPRSDQKFNFFENHLKKDHLPNIQWNKFRQILSNSRTE